jgi:uncharacterized membrane protein YphA (DoxX/SURF4 family)
LTPPQRIQSRVARSTRSRFLPSHNISTFNPISTETLRGTTDNPQPQELHLRNREYCPNKRGHLLLTILIELGGGTAIVLGWKTRTAALLILLFTMLVTLVFHRFWAVPPDDAQVQQLMFMKNVSVMGGLLVLYAFGPGKYAFERRAR